MAGRREDDKETYLAVARALFRMDRTAPDAADHASNWAEVKPDYVKRARKLMKAFDRDGITLLIPEAARAHSE